MDDFYFVANTKEELLVLVEPIREFLLKELGLTLHPAKIWLHRQEEGVPFLGKFVRNGKVSPLRRTIRKARNRMADSYAFDRNPYLVRAKEQSYKGLMKTII